MKIEDIKYPSVEFTHSDLALFNNTSNQKIWQAYDAARKNGIIVPTGNKKGKATYYQLADPSKATAGAIPTVPVTSKPEPAEPDEQKDGSTQTVPVISITPPEPKIEDMRPVVSLLVSSPIEDTDVKCPVCGTQMKSQVTDTGIWVFCPVKDSSCKSTEQPSGHGKNIQAAYAVACDKFKHIEA